MAIGSSLLAVIVNRQVTKSVNEILADPESLSGTQLELLHDPDIVIDPQLQTIFPQQALLLLQQGLSTGIVQAIIVAMGAVWLMSIFGFLAGKERLVPNVDGKKFGFH